MSHSGNFDTRQKWADRTFWTFIGMVTAAAVGNAKFGMSEGVATTLITTGGGLYATVQSVMILGKVWHDKGSE